METFLEELGGSSNAACPANRDDAIGAGADSGAMPSTGARYLDWTDNADPNAESEQARHLFWPMQRAKRRSRRFMRKPVRRVRGGVRRVLHREGNGTCGRRRLDGRGIASFIAQLTDDQIDDLLRGR